MAQPAVTSLRPVADPAGQAGVVTLPVSRESRPVTDAELVRRVRIGDLEAFDTLVDRHIDSAYAAALALLANPADAEDACQDAFITALERLGQCRDASRFRAWLLQIVRNRAHNIRRYRGIRCEVDLEGISPLRSTSNPARDLERAELRAHLVIALRRLSELQRQVVVLFDMEGWTHRDISEMLEISEGASRAALFKGRSALRRLLERPSDRPD